MGLVLNPYAYRIGHVRSWSDSWYLVSAEYVEFLHSSMALKAFVYYVLFKFYPTRFSYWLISHTEILFFNNNMYIWLYLYEASGRFKITKYIRRFKFGLFKNLRMKTYWLKKNLFHRNQIALGIFNFLRIFGSHIEKYDLFINYVIDDEDREKISDLREKYGYKWLGIEEIFILRTAFSLFFKSANPFALRYLSSILKSLIYLPLKGYKLSIYKLKGPRIFLFFFSYLKSMMKSWPYYRGYKMPFSSKIVFVLLRSIVFWLFFKPFINYLSKFLEYLCSFFGYSCIIRASIITNFSLSAFFIARYIITAIKNGFNYLDIVFPIRKTLNRFMQIKIFNNFVTRKSSLKDGYMNSFFFLNKKRVNVIFIYIIFIKYRLFMDNFHKYFTIFDTFLFFRLMCLNHFLVFPKITKINNQYRFRIGFCKSYIFKRFFFNVFKKKLFDFFANRMLAEEIAKHKRSLVKPLTEAQRKKYNENRRIKRLQKRAVVDLDEQRVISLRYNSSFNSKLSRLRIFSYVLKQGKRNILEINYNNVFTNKILKRYYTVKNRKISKTMFSSNLFNIIKFYVLLFIIKFFKVVRFKLSKFKIFKKKRKLYYSRNRRKKKLFKVFDKKFFVKKRYRLFRLSKVIFLTLLNSKFIFLNYLRYPMFLYLINIKKYKIFSKVFNRFFFSQTGQLNNLILTTVEKKNNLKVFKRNRKVFKRSYHSSFIISDQVIDILKSLLVQNDKLKGKRRIDYRKVYNRMNLERYKKRSFSYRNMPSKLLRKKINLFKTNNYNSELLTVVIEKNINCIIDISLLSNKNAFFDSNLKGLLVLKFYQIFYFLFILNLYGFARSYYALIYTSLKQCINNFIDNNDLFRIIELLNEIILNLKYSLKLFNYYLLDYRLKRNSIMFNFLFKLLQFFFDNLKISNSFYCYFLHVLKVISLNFKNIYSFDNISVRQLFIFIDNFWHIGFKLFKNKSLKAFTLFFFKFKYLFSIIYFFLRLLFTNWVYDDESYPFIYQQLVYFMPSGFLLKFDRYSEHYIPIMVNYNKRVTLMKTYYKYDNIISNNVFTKFLNNYKFIENKFFKFCFNKSKDNIFPVNIINYISYINDLLYSSNRVLGLNTELVANKLLSYSDKIVRVKARDHIKSFLYGFKFHFVGRFTRKQQSASMWFRQGFLPSSTMNAEVDYGMYTIPLRFSACTVKVWLYRGFYVPKRTFSYGKWL